MKMDSNNKPVTQRGSNILRRVYAQRSLAIVILILSMILVFSLTLHNFFSFANLSITLLALSTKMIVAIGMTFLLVSGLADLSVGSVYGFCGSVTAFLIVQNVPIYIAVLVGVVAAAGVGLVNGLIVEKLHVNFIIGTLATLGIVRGLVIFIAEQPIAFLPAEFTVVGQTKLLGIQSPVWIMVVLMVVCSPLLAKHRFFRQFYYIGSNERAALVSGIRVARLRIVNFIIASTFAGLAGIVYTARAGSATAVSGSGLELKVIAAAIVGGCSLSGGEGSILGTFLGVFLMELILDILVFSRLSTYWQDIVTGIVLILAVSVDYFLKTRGAQIPLRQEN